MLTNKSISTDFYQYGEQDNVTLIAYKEQVIWEFNDAFDSINISEDEEKQALKIDGNLILNGEIITNNV